MVAEAEIVNGQEALIRLKNWHKGSNSMSKKNARKFQSDSRILELATLDTEQFRVSSIAQPVSRYWRWNRGIIIRGEGVTELRDRFIGKSI